METPKNAAQRREEPITVGRLIQLLSEFHDATPVWLSEDNLLYLASTGGQHTAAGFGVVLRKGTKVTW